MGLRRSDMHHTTQFSNWGDSSIPARWRNESHWGDRHKRIVMKREPDKEAQRFVQAAPAGPEYDAHHFCGSNGWPRDWWFLGEDE